VTDEGLVRHSVGAHLPATHERGARSEADPCRREVEKGRRDPIGLEDLSVRAGTAREDDVRRLLGGKNMTAAPSAAGPRPSLYASARANTARTTAADQSSSVVRERMPPP
jgi:hypothetical protein